MKNLCLIFLAVIGLTNLKVISSDNYLSKSLQIKSPYYQTYDLNYYSQDTSAWSPEKDVSKSKKKYGKGSSGTGYKGGIGLGMGLGVPYGALGMKLYGDISYIQGGLGLGIMPLLWEPVFSLSGSIFFNKPDRNFRPKVSLAFSNITQAIFFYDESTLETLYSETHPGYGFYFGADIRPLNFIVIDFNLGYVGGELTNDEFKEKYEAEKSNLERQGYVFSDDEIMSPNGLKISMGMSLYLGIK